MKIWGLICVLLLAGCTRQSVLDRIATPQEQAFAIAAADALRADDMGGLARSTDPGIRADLFILADRVRPFLSTVDGPFTVTAAYAQRRLSAPESSIKTLLLQAGAGDRWAVTRVVLRVDGRSRSLVGMAVAPFDRDPAARHAFAVGARGLVGYAFLAAMLACAATCIWAVVLIWRRVWLPRRWLWTLGSLFGLGKIGIDWSTGQGSFAPLKASMLAVEAIQPSPYDPVVLGFGLPIVAIIVIGRWYAGPGRGADAPI